MTGVIIEATGGLLMPDNPDVTFAVPAAIPVAIPHESIEIMLLSLVQVTLSVISAVEPSAYVPVAVNWVIAPTARFAGDGGATVMEINLGEGVFAKQAVSPSAGAVISPKIIRKRINRICTVFFISNGGKAVPFLSVFINVSDCKITVMNNQILFCTTAVIRLFIVSRKCLCYAFL